jgi:hypothetical protein
MAKPPAEVSFPGDKNRRKKVRVRGIKQASKEIQKRLEKNLQDLLDNPEIFLPEIKGEIGKASFFGKNKDLMALTLQEIDSVSKKRHDKKWLTRRMGKKGGDLVCRALAGSLLAASGGDLSTVSVFKNPLFGSASYIRRGNGKQSHLAGIQNFNHTKLRMLVWDDHAKSGQWFFSWDKGFVFTGKNADAPDDWINYVLENASIGLSGSTIKWSKGLDETIVTNNTITESGWLKLEFDNGVIAGISRDSLVRAEESFVQSIAMSMMPPKIGEIIKSDWIWRPEGWPKGKDLPPEGIEKVEEVLQQWLLMLYDDKKLASACRSGILNSIKDGFVIGNRWYNSEDLDKMLEEMNGTDDEKEAISYILASLDTGIHVRSDGLIIDLEEEVIRFEDSSCHPVLVALWPKYGHIILDKMYEISEEEIGDIIDKQSQRKQGFGAFLRELKESLFIIKRLNRLPWKSEDLNSPLSFADFLIRHAIKNGVASTVSKARKSKGLEMAMGWAWLNVHDRTESDAWRFDESSRDKGGDWVPALRSLWDAAEDLLVNDNLDAIDDYKSGMKWLAEVSGSSLDY